MYLLDLEDIVEAFENLIEFFQTLFRFIGNFFKSLVLAFSYFIQMIPKVMETIGTLPSWLMAFGTITIGITIAYFIIGRTPGKNDK